MWSEIGIKMSGHLVAHLNIPAKISLVTLNHMILYSFSVHPATGSSMWNKLEDVFLQWNRTSFPPAVHQFSSLLRFALCGVEGQPDTKEPLIIHELFICTDLSNSHLAVENQRTLLENASFDSVFFYDYVRILSSFSSRIHERGKIIFKIIQCSCLKGYEKIKWMNMQWEIWVVYLWQIYTCL